MIIFLAGLIQGPPASALERGRTGIRPPEAETHQFPGFDSTKDIVGSAMIMGASIVPAIRSLTGPPARRFDVPRILASSSGDGLPLLNSEKATARPAWGRT